jgi:hypothetical protein
VGLFVVLTLAIGAPFVGADPSAATVLGQLVDAGGRGAVGRSVELVRDGAVVATTVTAVGGEFMFVGIAPGSYVVRTMVNNHAAGLKVSVNAGETAPVTVVLPSLATASPAVGPIAAIFLQSLTFVGGTIVNPIFTQVQKFDDQVFFQQFGIQEVLDVQRFFRVGPYGSF